MRLTTNTNTDTQTKAPEFTSRQLFTQAVSYYSEPRPTPHALNANLSTSISLNKEVHPIIHARGRKGGREVLQVDRSKYRKRDVEGVFCLSFISNLLRRSVNRNTHFSSEIFFLLAESPFHLLLSAEYFLFGFRDFHRTLGGLAGLGVLLSSFQQSFLSGSNCVD